MKIVKKSAQEHYKLSLILLDWSVRESFHLLYYLQRQQGVAQDDFEVVFLEYHSRVAPGLQALAQRVDQWILLEMPENLYYHKHLMYNVGLALCRGEIVVICDSDAMVTPAFIHGILRAFEEHPNCVLHLDQFRNNRKELYPFNHPGLAEVTGRGCINWADGRTRGLATAFDALHNRNYGACFCARRQDLLAIGGADEHVDYVGHICGPYDLTFRLVNRGLREIWHETEFLYHTWHPGQAGQDNYLGPHDGRHMALASLEALQTGRVEPLVANRAIARLRRGEVPAPERMPGLLIADDYRRILDQEFVRRGGLARVRRSQPSLEGLHGGYFLQSEGGRYLARPLRRPRPAPALAGPNPRRLKADLRRALPPRLRLAVGLLLHLGLLAALPYLVLGPYRPRVLALLRREGTAGGRPPSPRDLLARLSGIQASLCSLAAGLGPRQGGGADQPSLVAVERRYKQYFLRALAWLGQTPPTPVVTVRGERDMLELLGEMERNPDQGSLLLTRELFLGYHILLTGRPRAVRYALA